MARSASCRALGRGGRIALLAFASRSYRRISAHFAGVTESLRPVEEPGDGPIDPEVTRLVR